MHDPRSLLPALALTLFLGPAAAPALATVADDLCGPLDDPCIVTGSVIVDPASTLDFGDRELRLEDGATLTWHTDLIIRAAVCDFRPASKLVEAKTSPGTGFLELDCDASTLAGATTTVGAGILVEGDGPHVLSGKIKAKGDEVGVIAVDSYGTPGHITISGKIQAKSKLGPPPGEFRFVTNFGDITVAESARIKVQGTTAGDGGELVWFEAGSGTLTIDGKIDARAKDGSYDFNFEADQNVTFGPKSQIKAKAKHRGAEIAINSQSADVTVRGKIQAPAKEPELGDGGRVHICAGDDILVDGKASIDTSSGFWGSIILGAFDVARVGTVAIGAKLTSKTDGDIEVCGGTSGSISSSSKVEPDPEAVGTTFDCLSPSSQVIFFLDCAVD